MTYVRSLVSAIALTGSVALATSPAHAGGIDAGTLIENTATATYDVNGTPGSVDSNTITIRVDELLDVTVTSLDGGAVPADSGSAVLTFSITNTGNGPEAFQLTADPSVAGNDFDATVTGIAIDTNGNGIYDEGVDTILGAGDNSGELAPDASLTVFVLVTTPGGVSDGDNSQVNLTADAVTGTGAPGTAFAGAGVDGGDAIVGLTGASNDALGSLIAGVVTVNLVKSADIADPFGGNQPVPGAIITYRIVATVTGTGSIDDLTITDAYPTGTTYRPTTLTLDGGTLTDADDADAGKADATGIEVLLGTTTGGVSHTITFDVVID